MSSSASMFSQMARLESQLKSYEEEQQRLKKEERRIMIENEDSIHSGRNYYNNPLIDNIEMAGREQRKLRNQQILKKLEDFEMKTSVFAAQSEKLRVMKNEYDALVKDFKGTWQTPKRPATFGKPRYTSSVGVNTEVSGPIVPLNGNSSSERIGSIKSMKVEEPRRKRSVGFLSDISSTSESTVSKIKWSEITGLSSKADDSVDINLCTNDSISEDPDNLLGEDDDDNDPLDDTSSTTSASTTKASQGPENKIIRGNSANSPKKNSIKIPEKLKGKEKHNDDFIGKDNSSENNLNTKQNDTGNKNIGVTVGTKFNDPVKSDDSSQTQDSVSENTQNDVKHEDFEKKINGKSDSCNDFESKEREGGLSEPKQSTAKKVSEPDVSSREKKLLVEGLNVSATKVDSFLPLVTKDQKPDGLDRHRTHLQNENRIESKNQSIKNEKFLEKVMENNELSEKKQSLKMSDGTTKHLKEKDEKPTSAKNKKPGSLKLKVNYDDDSEDESSEKSSPKFSIGDGDAVKTGHFDDLEDFFDI